MLDHRIDTFITLCETLSYTKTAKKLCITQPAVTQHIKYLESYYDCELFLYEGKQLSITTKGEELLELSLAMKSNVEKIYDKISFKKVGISHIRLGATKSIADYIVPNAITNYMKADQSRLVDLMTDNTENLLKKVKEGVIDIAMIEGSFNKLDYEYEVFREEPFLCVASNQMQIEESDSIEKLFQYRLIIREQGSGTRSILENYLNDFCYNTTCFQTQIESDNFMSIKAMVEASIGITFLYRMVMEEELANGTLREIPLHGLPIMRPLYFVFSKDSLFKEEYLNFIHAFREVQEQPKEKR